MLLIVISVVHYECLMLEQSQNDVHGVLNVRKVVRRLSRLLQAVMSQCPAAKHVFPLSLQVKVGQQKDAKVISSLTQLEEETGSE